MSQHIAMAIGCHPDDIEFMMAGTLVLLKQAGYETHYMNIANGSCGSQVYPAAQLISIRRREAKEAARLLGAVFHPSLVDDLDVYYEDKTLRRLAAVIREVRPTVLLVHSPQDYMEDHTNACRLAVSAAFVRGMRNFWTIPRRKPVAGDVTLYHAMPNGLCDPLRRRIIPGAFVNTTAVFAEKMAALAVHRSQQDWLAKSQKMNQYLATMERYSREVGKLSRRFTHAEGWRRHLHWGYCAEDADPLREGLGKNYIVNKRYEAALERG